MAVLVRRAIHTRNEHLAGRLEAAASAAAVVTIDQETDTLLAQPLTAGWRADRQRRFRKHRRGRLTFLHHLAVPPTTTASDRSLRPSVVHRNVTGGFRADAFAQGYAARPTVADTARKRGHAVFATLLETAGAPLPLTTHDAHLRP